MDTTTTETKRHALALYLHHEAAARQTTAPAFAAKLTQLARQADQEPGAITSLRLDAILDVVSGLRTLAEGLAALDGYSITDLHDAQQRAEARRNAAGDFTTMRQHDAQARMLGNVIIRRSGDRQGIIAPERAATIHTTIFQTRQEINNYRRRQKRQRLV